MAATLRVLYVDDEPGLHNIGKLFLEQSGEFAVTTAISAPEAIRFLELERFDAIISDYQMPDMDGIQFLVEVRTRFGPIPFILFTGRGREEVVIQAINSGADFYLQKGGEPKAQFAELANKIRYAVSRTRAEEDLRESEEKYRHLIEHSDEVIVVAQDGMLKLINPKTVELTGYSEQELLSMQFSVFIHPEDRAMVVERYQKRMKGGESPSHYAFRLISKDGSIKWVELSVFVIDLDGRPATLNFLTDTTERKRAEDALRKSENLYHTLSESSPDMIWLVDADGIIPYINQRAAQVFGLTPADIIGKRTDLVFPKEIATHFMKEVNCVVTTKEIRTIEVLEQFPTGARWTSTRLVPITSPDNEVIQILGIATDITEHKRADDALRKSEERYKNISETTSDFVFSCIKPESGTYSIDWVAGAVEKITGYTIDELRAMECWRCLVHPDDAPVFDENITNLSEVTSRSCILRIRTKNGMERWLAVNTTHVPGKDSSSFSHVFGGCRDITERKLAEEVLKQSEEKYRTLFEGALNPILIADEEGRYVDANAAALRFLETEKEELVQKTVWDYSPGRLIEQQKQEHSPLTEPRTLETVYSVHGKEKTLILNVLPLDLLDKRHVIGIGQDITWRKRAEGALRENEERYRAIYDQSPIAIELYDGKGKLVHVNPACLKLFGIESMQVIQNFSLFADPNVNDEQKERLHKGETVQYSGPFDFGKVKTLNLYTTSREGIVWLDVLITPLGNRADSITGFLVHVQDITERKVAERVLLESEEKYRVIFNNDIYAICIFDLDTLNLLDVNDAFTKMYGYTRNELLSGMTVHEITVEHEASDSATGDAINHGTIFIPLRYHKKKDNTIFPVEIVGGPYIWNGKKVMFAIFHEITKREQAKAALRDSLAEKEVLLKEIHHRVKNNLQIVSGLMYLQSKFAKDPETKEILSACRNRITSMALLHENLFQVSNFSSVSMSPYINNLAKYLADSYETAKFLTFEVDIPVDISLDIDTGIAIGMIVTELATNSIKYAFTPGEAGTLEVALHPSGEGMLLTVRDNGKGLPEGYDLTAGPGLGMKLVTNFVRQIHGTLDVTSGQGTAIRIPFASGIVTGKGPVDGSH